MLSKLHWRNWKQAFEIYQDKRQLVVFLLGFSSGLPLLLTMGTLSVWLVEQGISKAAIGAFALVGLPYTFKFIWSPIIDRTHIPFLYRILGRRRSWMIVTQLALIAALLGLASSHPAQAPLLTAVMAILVAFCSASQDIVIDAYRVEILDKESYAAGAATAVFGYRVGMLVAGAGALYLASYMSWPLVYMSMAALVGIGIVTVLLSSEPAQTRNLIPLNSTFSQWVKEAVVAPFSEFMSRRYWVSILLFLILYKLGDAFLSNMTNPFYLEMGFSKMEIASVTKVFGLVALLVGLFLGGVANARYGIMKGMLICGVIHVVANLIFIAQAYVGHSVSLLMVTIAVEMVTNGMCTAALVAYMSSLCDHRFTATQYALLSAFASTGRTFLSSASGICAEEMGWPLYFGFVAVLAVPALLLLYWLMTRPEDKKEALA